MSQIITQLRQQTFEGHSITAYPLSQQYSEDIVRLRNQQRAKYFLAQDFELSVEKQNEWIAHYLKNDKDLGFVIANKSNQVVGTGFLSHYDGETVDMGRAVFDLSKVFASVYAIECMIIGLDIAFDLLKVKEVKADIRKDNFLLQKLIRKFGFQLIGERMIRDVPYCTFTLPATRRQYQKFNLVVLNRTKQKSC